MLHVSIKQRLNIKKLALILVLMISSSCANNSSELEGNIDISQSMKNFHELDVNSYNKGELFEAKILSIVRIKSELPDYYLYKYQIVIAPTKHKNMQLKEVEINFSDDIDKIMESGIIQNVDTNFSLNFPKWEDIGEFEAYQFDFVLGSFGDSYIENHFNIDKDLLNKHLSTLNITIFYDLSKENIEIEYKDEILEIDELADIPFGREDLKEIMNGEYFTESIKPF